jgi:hypothetical protein
LPCNVFFGFWYYLFTTFSRVGCCGHAINSATLRSVGDAHIKSLHGSQPSTQCCRCGSPTPVLDIRLML